jgi:membrane protein
MTPKAMLLPGRDVPMRVFLRDLVREIGEDHLLDYAGSVAFSAFLAIFPFLLFAVALAGLIVNPAALDSLINQVRGVAPDQVTQILNDRLHALVDGTRTSLLTLGAVGAIWASSGAVAALMTALNSAYDVPETRPFWKTRAIALGWTLAAAVLVILASVIAIAAPHVAAWIGGPVKIVISVLRWPVAVALMLLVIACLYHFLPDVDEPFRLISPGSVIAVLGWVLASIGFSQYVSHFGRYEVVYGALGSVIVLLLWMWLSSLVILIGGEINAILAQYAKARDGDPAPSLARPKTK